MFILEELQAELEIRFPEHSEGFSISNICKVLRHYKLWKVGGWVEVGQTFSLANCTSRIAHRNIHLHGGAFCKKSTIFKAITRRLKKVLLKTYIQTWIFMLFPTVCFKCSENEQFWKKSIIFLLAFNRTPIRWYLTELRALSNKRWPPFFIAWIDLPWPKKSLQGVPKGPSIGSLARYGRLKFWALASQWNHASRSRFCTWHKRTLHNHAGITHETGKKRPMRERSEEESEMGTREPHVQPAHQIQDTRESQVQEAQEDFKEESIRESRANKILLWLLSRSPILGLHE